MTPETDRDKAIWNAAIKAATSAVSRSRMRHQGDDSYSQGMDAGARYQCKASYKDVFSLSLPSDMVVVPREPTEEMIDAGVDAPGGTWGEHCAVIYRAMIGAHEE